MTKTIISGDSYATLRPLYTLKFADSNGQPFDLKGCEIRTTYKPQVDDDADDSTAAIAHELIIDEDGEVTSSIGLVLFGAVTLGEVHEHLTSSESAALPIDLPLFSDVELRKGDDVITWINNEALLVKRGFTNRA